MGNCNTHDLHSSAPAEPGSGVEAVFARHLFWPNRTRTVFQAALLLLPFLLAASYSRAATQGYVISWFATATNARDFKENCPLNKNGGGVQLAIRNLMDIGYSREAATKLANDPARQSGKDIRERITNRAIVNGKHVSVYNYPDAVPDPDIRPSQASTPMALIWGATRHSNSSIRKHTRKSTINCGARWVARSHSGRRRLRCPIQKSSHGMS